MSSIKPPRFFLISTISLFCVIVLLPIIYTLLTPFWAGIGSENTGLFPLFESRHLSLAKNSLALAGGTTILCLLIGVSLALFFNRTDLWGRHFFGILFFVPILIPPYIHAIVWTHLNHSFKYFFSVDIHSLWGAIFVLTLAYFPFVTLMTLAGLKSIDRNLEEASLINHNQIKTLQKITIPLVLPHILSGAIFVFIFSIVDFAVPDILRVRVYPIEIFIQFSAFYNAQGASVLSLPIVGITLFLIVLQKWYMKDRAYVQISAGMKSHERDRLGIFNVPAFLFCFVVIGLSVCLPIGVLLHTAGPFTIYKRVLSTSINQIGYSLLIASSGAVLTLVLGFLLSYLVERSKMSGKTIIEFTAFIPFAIPATTIGIALIKLWNWPLVDIIYQSSLIVIFGYTARFFSFSFVTTGSGLKQLNPHLEEAASLNIRHWMRVIRRIVFPMLRPSLIVGFFIVFILSFGELGTTLLIIPPGHETISMKIYNLMHYGAEEMVAALSLVLITMVLVFYGVFLLCYGRLSK
jgi:iron(III) transport system permease protein